MLKKIEIKKISLTINNLNLKACIAVYIVNKHHITTNKI